MPDEKKPTISRDDPGSMPVTQPVVSRWQRRDHLTEFDYKIMNLGRVYRSARAKKIQDPAVQKVVINYCTNVVDVVRKGNGLIFIGDPGVGKSAAASIIAMEAKRWTFTVRVTCHEEMQELQFHDRPFDDSISMIERIRSVDLLVLDNFNEDFIDDNRFGPRHMEKLMMRRQADAKATLLTTRIDTSVWTNDKRLKSLWGVLQATNVGVRIDGDDLRKQAAADFKALLNSEEE